MAFNPRPTSFDVPQPLVRSTFALDLLTQVATTLGVAEFSEVMARIFGKDIPEKVYRALQARLIAREIENPFILVEDGSHLADYDNAERVIRIHSSVIDNAQSTLRAAELLEILLHEFGHHIDNVLRQDFAQETGGFSAPPAPDASGEEGTRFAFWMVNLGRFDSDHVLLATCQPTPQHPSQAITANWDQAYEIIVQRYDSDRESTAQRHEHPDRENFEAGNGDSHHMTHFEIETILSQASFSEQERQSVYFGNWLRDYSQVLDPKIVRATSMPKGFPDVLSREALTRIVDVMSIKQFAALRKSDPKEFTVTPHKLGVYRASEHIDNPRNTDVKAFDPRLRDPDFEPVVAPGDPLLDIDYDTSMKRYIKHSVDFMERELQVTLHDKHNPAGLRAFGSALHVLEDFFAHSNFVELALIKNGYGEVLPWTSPAECKAGIPLVTGMFGASDALAGITGPLGEILFSINDVTYQPAKPGDRSLREQILLIMLEEHHNPAYLKTFQAYLAARDAWTHLPASEYLQRCAAYLKGTSAVTGNVLSLVMKDVLNLFGASIADWQTRNGLDPHKNGSTDPTHSQLSKDHAEHPLHPLAASLASEAVREVGRAMVDYWNEEPDADPIGLARSYFAHPLNTGWQDGIVRAWAKANPEAVRRSSSLIELEDIQSRVARTGSNVLEQMRKDGLAYLSFMRGELSDKNSPLWDVINLSAGGGLLYATLTQLGFFR